MLHTIGDIQPRAGKVNKSLKVTNGGVPDGSLGGARDS